MSHRLIADIWTQLEGRTDIDNILREVVGQYSFESSVASDPEELQRLSLRLVVFLKVVFDLQRTYVPCLTDPCKSSHLLQHKQLCFAVIHLVRIKSEVFHHHAGISTQYIAYRSFLARALVSGLRALWLHKRPFPSQLREKIQEAWKLEVENLNDQEKFLIRLVGQMQEACLQDPESELSSPACGQIELRNQDRVIVRALKSFTYSKRMEAD